MLSEILFNLSVLTSSIFVSKCHNTYRVREQEEVNGSEIKYLLIPCHIWQPQWSYRINMDFFVWKMRLQHLKGKRAMWHSGGLLCECVNRRWLWSESIAYNLHSQHHRYLLMFFFFPCWRKSYDIRIKTLCFSKGQTCNYWS